MASGSVAVLFVMGGIAALAMVISSLRENRLVRHQGFTKEAFVSRFGSMGVSPAVAEAVYAFYTAQSDMPDFKVAPDDELVQLLGKTREDIDEDAEAILTTLGASLPEEETLRSRKAPVDTVGDMVLWAAWVVSGCPPDVSTRS